MNTVYKNTILFQYNILKIHNICAMSEAVYHFDIKFPKGCINWLISQSFPTWKCSSFNKTDVIIDAFAQYSQKCPHGFVHVMNPFGLCALYIYTLGNVHYPFGICSVERSLLCSPKPHLINNSKTVTL